MRLFAALLLTLPLLSQIRVTFTQQGSEVLKAVGGRRIKGVGVVAITAQNFGPNIRTLQAQEVYAAAARAGISYISPSVAVALLNRSAAKSGAQIALDSITISSAVTGTMGITKTIPMANGISAALSLAPIVIPLIQHFLSSQLPQPGLVESHLMQGSWVISPLGMIPDGLLMLTRFQGNWKPVEAEFQ